MNKDHENTNSHSENIQPLVFEGLLCIQQIKDKITLSQLENFNHRLKHMSDTLLYTSHLVKYCKKDIYIHMYLLKTYKSQPEMATDIISIPSMFEQPELILEVRSRTNEGSKTEFPSVYTNCDLIYKHLICKNLICRDFCQHKIIGS